MPPASYASSTSQDVNAAKVLSSKSTITGLLPVVGVPLSLVSYGGTPAVSLRTGFGVLMSIHSHRKML